MIESAYIGCVDDSLCKDAGRSICLDSVEYSLWILFLKYLDGFEAERAESAALIGKPYKPIIVEKYKRLLWSAAKVPEGNIDLNKALTGDEILNFISSG